MVMTTHRVNIALTAAANVMLLLFVGLVTTMSVNAAGSTWKEHMARRAHEIHHNQATDMELCVPVCHRIRGFPS